MNKLRAANSEFQMSYCCKITINDESMSKPDEFTKYPFIQFPIDIAFKKKTSQSSTAYNGHSERAVDENYNSDYNQKSCTHTKDQHNPWWRVDLGSEHIITGKTS